MGSSRNAAVLQLGARSEYGHKVAGCSRRLHPAFFCLSRARPVKIGARPTAPVSTMSDHASALAELLQRWLPRTDTPTLLLNTEAPGVIAPLAESGAVLTHCHFRAGAALAHAAAGLEALNFPDTPTQRPRRVIWHWPKAKAEAGMILDWLAGWLQPEGELWLFGANRGGIRSAPRFLAQRGWSARKVGSARHSVLLQASPPGGTEDFDLQTCWSRVAVPEADDHLLWSLPGVFSHGRVDKGSRHLLPFLHDLPGPVLDFGCGAGLLSLVAGSRQPGLKLTGVDNDWLAVLSSRRTAEANNLNLEVHWQDGLASLAGQWGSLITNPPFHTGLATQYETTRDMIARSRQLLRPGGRWLAVVNDHLPYRDWLHEYLREVECLHHGGGFRVWQATV